MKPTPQNLPGLADLFSEIISKKSRRKGRPRKYISPKHRAWEKRELGVRKMTPRMVQNYHNAQRAFDILAKHEGAEQLLVYFRNRRAILAGIGRIPEKKYMIGAACSVVYHGLRGAAAHAEIRKFRYGDRWPDTNRLLRKIRKAVREYRNLYPYQSCDEFRRDVEGVFEDFKKYELKYYQEEK